MSTQISLLYSYVSQAVFRRDSLCQDRLLPAGGSLAKIVKNGKTFWYRRYYQDGQHSEFLGDEEKIRDLLEREKELIERDKHIANYMLSMRNMGFPMPAAWSQKAMRALARAGFLKQDGIVRIDDGIINSYAAYYGDEYLARKARTRFRRNNILEFHVSECSLRKARKIIRSLPGIPVELRLVPDYVVENWDPYVFLCVPGIAMKIPELQFFLQWKRELGKFRKEEELLEKHLH